jgi:N-hydroxyarylamine O-acetyltransferase
MPLDADVVDRYLARLGTTRPARADLDALRDLQQRHVHHIPFENVDCYRRRPLPLGAGAARKIADEGRGGGCYELNSAMSLLLEALGFDVTVLGGRIYDGDTLTFPLRHLVLRVRIGDDAYLVDTGFGFGSNRNSLHPLDLGDDAPQEDAHGEYRLVTTPDGDHDVLRAGRPLYRVEPHPRELEEFTATLWWFLTSPDSDFLGGMFCILPHASGRLSLRDRSLSEVRDGEKTVTELPDEAAVREVLATRFGVMVDDIPDLGEDARDIAPRMAAEAGSRGLTVGAA